MANFYPVTVASLSKYYSKSAFPLLIIILLCGAWPVYAQINKSAPLYPVLKDGKWGYINQTGRLVIEPRFSSAGEFSEGLAPVQLNKYGKYGYIDTKGRMVIPRAFNDARPFNGNSAVITNVDHQYAVIDQTGRIIARSQDEYVASFSENLAIFERPKDKYGYLNEKGETVIDPVFNRAEDFHDGLAAVAVWNGVKMMFGYIDRKGGWAVKPEYVYAYNFAEGLAVVVLKGNTVVFDGYTMSILGNATYGIINKKNSMLAKYDFTQTAFTYSDGLLAVEVDGKWGYLDKTAKMAIKPQFYQAGNFSEGLAPVTVKGRKYYIDKSGRLVFQADYWELGKFHNGLARVTNLGPGAVPPSGYINRKGQLIWPLTN